MQRSTLGSGQLTQPLLVQAAKRMSRILILCLLATAFTSPAGAALYTYSFTGFADVGNLGNVSGTVTFSDTLQDMVVEADGDDFQDVFRTEDPSLYSATLSFDSFSNDIPDFTTTIPNEGGFRLNGAVGATDDDPNLFGFDSVYIDVKDNAEGLAITFADTEWFSGTNRSLVDWLNLMAEADLGEFVRDNLDFVYFQSGNVLLQGRVTSFDFVSVTPVPLPAGGGLLLAGLLTLAARRRSA